MHALNVANGQTLWQRALNYSFGATSLGSDVVYSGLVGVPPLVGPGLKAYNSRSGVLLRTFRKRSTIPV